MKHLTKVALSASVMIVAAQAMSATAKEVEAPLHVQTFADAAGVTGLDAFSRFEVQQATSRAFREIVTGFETDGETILERYRVAQQSDFVQGGSIDVDNPSPKPSVAACHTACHSACHGAGGGYC